MAIDWTRSILVSDENTTQVICGKEILYVRGLAAGRSIVSVEKTSDDGSTAIFTITYTDGTTSTFSIQEADFDYSVIAPEFDPAVSYVAGDLVTYNEKLYQFINDHSGAWDIHDVKQVTLVDIMTDQLGEIIAPDYDEDSAYSVGEYVIYESKLYRFTSAHTAGDPWDSSEVESIVVTSYFVDDDKLHAYAVSFSNLANQFRNIHYNVGDYVYYNDGTGTAIYRFKAEHIAGNPWSDSEVDEVKITSDFIDWNRLYTILSDNIANEFSPSTQYMAGEYVMHNGLLYQFDTDHTGIWSLDDVTHVKLFPLIPTIESSVNRRLIKWNVANDFDQYTNYSVGDYVLYEDYLYRFTSNHTAGAWNASHATRVSVTGELKTKLPDAPSDDKTYGRKNGAWSEVSGLKTLTFYVNPFDGSDSNVGDEDHPFKSLSKAVDSVPENGNGVIYLKYPTFNFYDEPVISNKQISFICTSSQDMQLTYPIDIVIENSHVEFHGYSTSYDFSLYRGLDIKNSKVIIENFRRVNFETFAGVEASAEIKLQSARLIAECPVQITEAQEGSHITAIKALDGSVVSMDALTFIPDDDSDCTIFHADGSLIFCQSLTDVLFEQCVTANGGRILWGQQAIEYTDAEIDAMLADKADVITATASGVIASFDDGVDAPVVDLTASIEPVQEGSGDPSPSNVRPISGWTSCNVVVSPTSSALDGKTYSIYFGEAGTVYGGSFNVSTGQLTVNKEIVDLGTLSWTRNTTGSNPYFRASLAGTKRYAINTETGCLCDRYKLIASVNGSSFASNANNYECTILSNSAILAIRNDTYSTASDFATAMSGAQFVYELVTPITYQLTPTEVTTLLGQNNVWADTGDISLTYFVTGGQDIGKAIDNTIKTAKYDDGKTRTMITQSSETTMTASKNYAIGDLLIANNQLLRATAVITSGTTIVIGTSGNAEVIDLATIISELNQRISALES